jgi:hypothetical protein
MTLIWQIGTHDSVASLLGSAIADDAFSLNSSKFGDYSSYFIYPIELEINLKNTTNTARSASHLDP